MILMVRNQKFKDKKYNKDKYQNNNQKEFYKNLEEEEDLEKGKRLTDRKLIKL